MMQLLIATTNMEKFRDFKSVLGDGFEVFSLLDKGDSYQVVESGESFEDNAILKAREAWNRYKIPVLADDSGLEVIALNGLPGVKSSRYADENRPDAKRSALKVVHDMGSQSIRDCKMVTALCYIDEDGEFTFRGFLEGFVSKEMKGTSNYHFDNIITLEDGGPTLGELPLEDRYLHSSRIRALTKLTNYFEELYDVEDISELKDYDEG